MPYDEKVYKISKLLQTLGLPQSQTDIISYLLFVDSPVTMRDIAYHCNRDEPAVSVSLTHLINIKFVLVQKSAIQNKVGRKTNLYAISPHVIDTIEDLMISDYNNKVQNIELIRNAISKEDEEKTKRNNL